MYTKTARDRTVQFALTLYNRGNFLYNVNLYCTFCADLLYIIYRVLHQQREPAEGKPGRERPPD